MILILAAAIAVQAPATPSPAVCPDIDTPEAFVCRAVQDETAGNYTAAAEDFESAANASPAGVPATARMWAAAGNMWIAAHQPGKAALALDRALAGTALQAEQRGEALLDRARVAEAQNDVATARARVNEAAAFIPGQPFLWYFSSALAIREGDAAAAKSAIDWALVLAPNDPAILFEAGHAYHFAGEIEKARDFWSRARTADVDGEVGRKAQEALQLLPPQPADGAAGPPEQKRN